MVQFFGNSQTGLGRLGQAISGGLAEGAQYGVNRGRLQDAFAPLLQDPRFADLAKLAPALLSTTGGSQALAEIAPILINAAMTKGVPIPGAEETPGMQGQQNGSISNKLNSIQKPGLTQGNRPNQNIQNQNNQSQQIGQQLGQQLQGQIKPFANESQPFNLDFSIPNNFQGIITPDMEAKQVKAMVDRGATQPQIDSYRQAVDRRNKGLITIDQLNDEFFQKGKERISTALGLESTVKNFVSERMPNGSNDDKDIAYSMMQDAIKGQEVPDLTRAYSQIEKPLNDVLEEKKTFAERIPDNQLDNWGFGISEQGQDFLKDSAKSLIKRAPIMKNILKNAFLDKGNNIFDISKILTPQTPEMKNQTSKIKDFLGEMGKKPISEIRKDQQKYSSDIVKDLSKKWNDSSSAVDVIYDLKKKGYLLPVISSIFGKIDEEGKLSTEQKADVNRALESPILLKDWF